MANAPELDQGVGKARKILPRQQTHGTGSAAQGSAQPNTRIQKQTEFRQGSLILFVSTLSCPQSRVAPNVGNLGSSGPTSATWSVGTGTKSQSGCQFSVCSLSLVSVSFADNSSFEPLFLQSDQTRRAADVVNLTDIFRNIRLGRQTVQK